MTERIKHSKIAVTATILPLAVWLYLALLAGYFFITSKLGDSFFSGYEGAWAIGLVFYFVLFVLIPTCGHLAGIICGIIGLFSNDKKRIFAVIGLVLSILPFAAGFVIYESGYDFGIR